MCIRDRIIVALLLYVIFIKHIQGLGRSGGQIHILRRETPTLLYNFGARLYSAKCWYINFLRRFLH